MQGRRQILLLLSIMLIVVLGVSGIILLSLYRAAFEQQRERLIEIAKTRARMIEAVARFDARYSVFDIPGDAAAATLDQIREAHKNFEGIGKTGEFRLGMREGDQIIFLLPPRFPVPEYSATVPVSSEIAEPMRRAISGESGTMVACGFRRQRILAAYEPVAELNWGIIAKVDLAEIRAPFVRAGLLAGIAGLALIVAGSVLFLRIGNPIIRRLEENEEKYRSMFESAADILILIDKRGTIIDCNPAGCSGYGFPREEFLGRNVREVIHPDQHVFLDSAYEAVAEGRTIRRDSVHVRRDFSTFPVEAQLSPIVHRGREAILMAVRDISARKEAERALRESERRFRELAETIEEVFWVSVPEWNEVIYISPAYEKIWGRSRQSLYENPFSWMDAIVEEDRERVRARLQEMTDHDFTNPLIGEFRIVRPDGGVRWILDRAFPVRDEQGGIHRIAGVAEDITERKLAEEALRESEARYRTLSESLEETVRRKVAELRQAESLAAIGRTVSVVAHEIRNPLQNIHIGVESLKQELGDYQSKKEIFEEIEYGIDLLRTIVTELLDFSSPVKLQYATATVGQIVNRAVSMSAAESGNIHVSYALENEEREVRVDVQKIIRVLINIISNAIEAMPQGGDLRVSSKFFEENGAASLNLSVSDTGAGMDENQLLRLFEPFFTTKTRGTGLGLSISKKIIDAHNGRLRVTSKLNAGTTVEILLPVQRPKNSTG
ncbi:MAG: PAS domain-containing sensor histidine kinase [Candidatus Abyssobacteria bacterium SURF_5]|uniref:histidine kinase n=1 Tax=Abyssobacteria bacterium (strain SURF_5) TaxID=2093360 RepID=A0A3A4NUK9_ABYX5|nr:MAG: PAS domain-containing sensor histidine kinase [Candidatus Abyssubacteria bacterium SURF_5]